MGLKSAALPERYKAYDAATLILYLLNELENTSIILLPMQLLN